MKLIVITAQITFASASSARIRASVKISYFISRLTPQNIRSRTLPSSHVCVGVVNALDNKLMLTVDILFCTK